MTTPSDEVQRGSVISYRYLWYREDRRGETEGRKERPVCVILSIRRRDGEIVMALLPITTQPPASGTKAVEVPETERHRAGLDRGRRSWVVVDEFNYDVLTRSFVIGPDVEPQGRFSTAFLARLAREAYTYLSRPSARVDRTRE